MAADDIVEKASIALTAAVAVFLIWLSPAFLAGLFAGALLYALGERALEKEEEDGEEDAGLPGDEEETR